MKRSPSLSQVYVGNGWLQPSTMSFLWGVSPSFLERMYDYKARRAHILGNNIADYRRAQPGILYMTKQSDNGEWEILSVLCKPVNGDMEHQESISPLYKLHGGLTPCATNDVMHSLQYDLHHTQIYHDPDRIDWAVEARQYLSEDLATENGFQDDVNTSRPFSVPRVITTRNILYPGSQPETGTLPQTTDADMLKSYFKTNVSTVAESDKLSGGGRDIVRQPFVKKYSPTQFVAVHQHGYYDHNLKRLIMGDDAIYLRRDNNAAMKDGPFHLPRDIWEIYALEPLGMRMLGATFGVTLTLDILKELENTYLMPRYRGDKHLTSIDTMMENAGLVDPLRYDRINRQKAMAYDMIKEYHKQTPLSLS